MEYNVDLPHVGPALTSNSYVVIPVAKVIYYLCLYSTHRTEYIFTAVCIFTDRHAYCGKGTQQKKKRTCSLHKIVDFHSVYITATWSQIAK